MFFPGQHGILSAYEEDIFPAFAAKGIAVLAVAYPRQNGAHGTSHLNEILALGARVVASAQSTCPGQRVVVYGRSLGSMVAAYVAARSQLTGLILESAAPARSSAIRLRLSARWYLAPLALLPVSRLLPHDYSLAEALSNTRGVPAVVFQGTADSETPLSFLRVAGVPDNLRLVVVSGGSHPTTYLLARDRIINTALSMLRSQRSCHFLVDCPKADARDDKNASDSDTGHGRYRPTTDVRSLNLPIAKRSVTDDNLLLTAALYW